MDSERPATGSGPNDTTNDPPPGYWSFMIRPDKAPTDQFDRLLRGIAFCISRNIEQTDNYDLTPAQLAAFYRSVGGNYDALFTTVPHQSISLIYRSLGCLHSLQPVSGEDKYAYPSVPALKPSGFVTWQTIQLLLGPAEHVPLIQQALQKFNVVDPKTNEPFPKAIPAEVFPTRPDEQMRRWHDNVSDRLRREAVEAAVRARNVEPNRRRRTISPDEEDYSADDEGRNFAARHFENPLYKNGKKDERPGVFRTVTKHAPPVVRQGGAIVANTVSNIISPFLWTGNSNKRASSDRMPHDDESNSRPASSSRPYNTGHRASYAHQGGGTPRRNSPRRSSQGAATPTSDSEAERLAQSGRYSRRHRSQEPPSSRLSPDMFGDQGERRSRSSSYNNLYNHDRDSRDPRRFRDPDVSSPAGHPHATKVAFGAQPEYFPAGGYHPSMPPRSPRWEARPDIHARNPSYPNIDASLPRHRPSFPSDHEGRRNSSFAASPADSRSPAPSSQPLGRQSSLRHKSSSDRPSNSPDAPLDGVGGRRYTNEVPWK